MILNIRYNINRENEDQKGQIYNKLSNTLSIFYTNPTYYLASISINISFVKEDKRHYLYILKSRLQSEDDVRNIVYYIEDSCMAKGISIQEIDRLFIRMSINRFQDIPQ